MSGADGRRVDFADLVGADLIQVTTNLNRELARVDNAETIHAVAAWLSERSDGWYVPREGVRVARTRIGFSAGGRSMGNVGVAEGLLTAHRRGGFYQRDSEPEDRAELFALIGFDLSAD